MGLFAYAFYENQSLVPGKLMIVVAHNQEEADYKMRQSGHLIINGQGELLELPQEAAGWFCFFADREFRGITELPFTTLTWH